MAIDTEPTSAWDQETLTFYDQAAPDYVDKGGTDPSRWLCDFMQALPAKARILELGCGSGRDALAMLAGGFDVDATDGTPAMAAKATRRLGRSVHVMRFDELSAVSIYDGIWANASLLHVPRIALSAILARILRALRPGGLHFASYKAGDRAGRDIFGRYYNHLNRNTVEHFYLQSGQWDVLSVTDYTARGYGDDQSPWIAIVARKPAR